jgi:hypothetical protein
MGIVGCVLLCFVQESVYYCSNITEYTTLYKNSWLGRYLPVLEETYYY